MLVINKPFYALVWKKKNKKLGIKKGEFVTWEEGYYIESSEADVWRDWRILNRERSKEPFEVKKLIVITETTAAI